jgi:tetratricopeptide (TPR) repeat protein
VRDLRIVQLESPNPGKEGDHVYRTRQPCRALGELPGISVQSGSWLSPALHAGLTTADVLVLCDVVDPDLVAIVEARRRAGRLTVYEINDHFLAVKAGNPTGYMGKSPLLRSLSSLLAARSHAIQFSVPELAREFAHLGATSAVFVNHLWDVPETTPAKVRSTSDRIWLGWGGSQGHADDIKWVAPALRAALQRHPRLGVSVMGAAALLPALADLPTDRLRTRPTGSLERYYDFVGELDIGFCPLLPTDFNRCRSDVKFLELARCGVPALCSDLAPYRDAVRSGENGFLFRNLDELGAQIDRLVADPTLRARIGAAAHAHAINERRERIHAPRRLGQYLSWQATAQELAGAGRAEPAIDSTSGSATAAAADQGGSRPFADSRYEIFGSEPVEQILREALMGAIAGQLDQALASCKRAQRLAPHFYLPWLYLGMLDTDPQRALPALDTARRLAPGSVNVALQRGLRLEAAGRIADAIGAYEECGHLAPVLGAGATQLGALAEKGGRIAEACSHYERAHADNPYLAPPVLRLAQIALAARDPGRATQLLEGALGHDPKLWLFHFLLGRAYGEVGRWQAANHHLERALVDSDEPAPVLALLAKSQIALGNVTAAQATVGELRRLGQLAG